MINWVDIVLILIFVAVVVIEATRGFGRAIFDLVAVIISAKAAYLACLPLHQMIKVVHDSHCNQTVMYTGAFVVVGGVFLFFGHLLYASTLVSAEAFETAFGALCGIGVAITLGHVFVQAIFLSPSMALTGSFLAEEFLRFETYRKIMWMLYKFAHGG